MDSMMQDKTGHWVPAVPLPYYSFLSLQCPACWKRFWRHATYQKHYSQAHHAD